MDDSTLMDQVQSCELPLEEWSHRLHVRVAFLLLRGNPFDEALRRLRSAIQNYNRFHEVPDNLTSGYHETLTCAWLTLISSRMNAAAEAPSSDAFCETNPDLLEKSLLRKFYSPERLISWEAKRRFIKPDRQALPDVVAA